MTKTIEHVVYTVFSPTDYRFQMVDFQTEQGTYEKKPAFVSKIMKATYDEEEYDAIYCFNLSYKIETKIIVSETSHSWEHLVKYSYRNQLHE